MEEDELLNSLIDDELIVNQDSRKPSVEMEVDLAAEQENAEENELNVSNLETDLSELEEDKKTAEKKPALQTEKGSSKKEESTRYRPLHLPLARIKQIIKMDPDVHMAGSEAVFLIAKAAELFIELLSKDAYAFTSSAKKKTIQKKDVDSAITNADALVFLDGALDF